MATVTKDFKIKYGLIVEGSNATVNGYSILTKSQADQNYIIGLIGGSATPNAEPDTVVLRDGNADFSAHYITADLFIGDLDGTASFVNSLSNLSTSDLSEGTNLYYTDSRVKNVLTGATKTNIQITEIGGQLHITAENGVADSTTDDLAEGTTNKYFTDQRAQDALSGMYEPSGAISTAINALTTSDIEEGTNLYFTEQRAIDAVGGSATSANTPNTVVKRDGFGYFAISQIDADNKLTAPDVRLGNAGQIRDNAGTLQVNAYDNNNLNLRADNAVIIEASAGSVDLYGTAAYVNEDEIVTRTATQDLSNKRFIDTLYFTDGTTIANEGEIAVRAISHDFDVKANYGNLNLTSVSGDIILQSNGGQYIGSSSVGNQIATNSYVDNAVAGLNWKQAVNLLWDDDHITMSGSTGTLALDGHSALTQADDGYRILTINMGSDNGIWVYTDNGTNWSISRAADADTYTELVGAAVYVMEGTQYGSTSWVQGNHYITDFTNQSWTQFSGQGSVTAGTGILVDGLQVSVDFDVVASQTDLSTGLGTKQDTLSAGDGIYIDGSNQITSRHYGGGGLKFVFSEAAIDRSIVDTWYDASGAASTAEQNANYYTDGQLENYTPTSNLESLISGYGFAYTSAIPTSTDGLSEGTTNKYYTDARVKDVLTGATKTNISITEVAGELIITAENGVADSTTDDLQEGTFNHYFTDERAKTAAADLLTSATKSNITITGTGAGLTITAENGVADSTTDDLEEGSTNLYFTDQRAVDAITNSTIYPTVVDINDYRREEATQQYVGTASTVTAHTFTGNKSVKYLARVVGVVGGTLHSQITELVVTVDGNNNVHLTEYGSVHTTEPALATFTADYSNGEFRLLATTANNGMEVIVAATIMSWAD